MNITKRRLSTASSSRVLTPIDTPDKIAYTVSGVCEATGLSKSDFYKKTKAGLFVLRHDGRKTYVDAASVRAWWLSLTTAQPSKKNLPPMALRKRQAVAEASTCLREGKRSFASAAE
jgi:hypothetical protein